MKTPTSLRLLSPLLLASLCAPVLSAGCSSSSESSDHTADEHHVFFVGYVYDGAKGVRLQAKDLMSITLKYRDKVVRTTIEPDGRFVTIDPLPTWQDYAVYIVAPNYRAFVSRNPGIDVPKSLAMTAGVATTATVQTFQFDAYLFPATLKAPAVTIRVEKADAFTTSPMPAAASGTIRLRPETSSLLEYRSDLPSTATATARRWANDEDLLNQTITKPFADGRVEIAAGELAYGVPYQIAVFDVKDYQPIVMSGDRALVAGTVTSRSVTIPRELKEPLRIIGTNADACMPPAGTAMEYSARIDITFNENIELVGSTYLEEIDNGVVVAPTGSVSMGGTYATYCSLRQGTDPTKQERGTAVIVQDNVMSLGFSPAAGLSTMSLYGQPCTIPPTLTSVTYGGLTNIFVRPKGDSSRKRSLGEMVAETMKGSSGGGYGNASLSCPPKANPYYPGP